MFHLLTLPALILALGCVSAFAAGSHSFSAGSATADFLYHVAMEYSDSGRYHQAMHELRKLLLVEPNNTEAMQKLQELEALVQVEREQAINLALASRERQLAQLAPVYPARRPGPSHPRPEAAIPTRPLPEVIQEAADALGRLPLIDPLRAPDPAVNTVKWFYVFGVAGDPDSGALQEPQQVFVELPWTAGGRVEIRIIDADTRGLRDEMAGGWDTATAFRLYGGAGLLDSTIVGPEAADGTVVPFGPLRFEDGEYRPHGVVFRIEAEGLKGNDNNLFAVQVSPANAQVFSYSPAIRLAPEPGATMDFFPAIPKGTTRITEANYDLDADGGEAALIPRRPTGRAAGRVPLRNSASAAWASTGVAVPPGTDDARWTYRITKGSQHKANMVFRISDQTGRPLPIYTTPGRTSGVPGRVDPSTEYSAWGRTSGLPGVPDAEPSPSACNTFTFDASGSYDPDNDALTYLWTFGDGQTATGVSARHTYETAGEYRVLLEVTDTSCMTCNTAKTEQVVLVNTPPTAVLIAPDLVCANGSTSFSAAQSSDATETTLTYRWDFGDGTTAEGMEATHAYGSGGTYQVQLVVDDGRGTSCSTDSAARIIRVNSPPVARANDPVTLCQQTALEPLEVGFSAVTSSDPDLDGLNYRWDYGDGRTGRGEQVSHVYEKGGRYTATLTVDDGSGSSCATDATTIPIHVNIAPQVAVAPQISGCPSQPVQFDAAGTTDPDGDLLTYRWEFGNGEVGRGATPTYTYAESGDFPVRLTVDDGSGLSCGTVTTTVTADINAPPVANMLVTPQAAGSSSR